MNPVRELLILSMTKPREGMARLLSLRVPQALALAGLLLVAIVSALLVHLNIASLPAEIQTFAYQIFGTPFYTAAIQFAALFVIALLIWQVGRWRGGQGDLTGSLLLTAWLQAIMLALQLFLILLSLALPPFAGLFGYLSFVYMFWLISHFIAELHQFRSVAKTFLGIIATLICTMLILSLLLSLILPPEVLS